MPTYLVKWSEEIEGLGPDGGPTSLACSAEKIEAESHAHAARRVALARGLRVGQRFRVVQYVPSPDRPSERWQDATLDVGGRASGPSTSSGTTRRDVAL
jgi:hypothetical protein